MVVDRKIRVLVAKPGLDGHDVGAKVVARSLKEAGFDVTYTGLRKSPEEIVRRAQDLDVDVIGLSLLSGSHLSFCRRLRALRKEHGLKDVLLLVGGVMALFVSMTRWPAVGLLSSKPELYARFLTAHGQNMLIYWIIFFEVAGLYFGGATVLNARLAAPRLAWLAYALMLGGALMTNIVAPTKMTGQPGKP